jgi:hypothetical protein
VVESVIPAGLFFRHPQKGTPIPIMAKTQQKFSIWVRVGNRTDRNRFSVLEKSRAWGRPQMAEYRAYILDDDGHISAAIGFLCPDDEAATKYARQFVDGHDVELWQGDRQIATFDCEAE